MNLVKSSQGEFQKEDRKYKKDKNNMYFTGNSVVRNLR